MDWKRLERAAWLSLGLHLIAGMAMLLVLSRGLETNPDLSDRMGFIAGHRGLWTLAWGIWNAAALSILYFYSSFARAHKSRAEILRVAVVAVCADLTAEVMEMFVLPGLAQAGRVASFLAVHRAAVVLTGFFANALYTLAALLLLWPARGAYPAWVTAAGLAVGVFGAVLSVAAWIDSAAGMFWANAFLLPSLLLWQAGVALRARNLCQRP